MIAVTSMRNSATSKQIIMQFAHEKCWPRLDKPRIDNPLAVALERSHSNSLFQGTASKKKKKLFRNPGLKLELILFFCSIQRMHTNATSAATPRLALVNLDFQSEISWETFGLFANVALQLHDAAVIRVLPQTDQKWNNIWKLETKQQCGPKARTYSKCSSLIIQKHIMQCLNATCQMWTKGFNVFKCEQRASCSWHGWIKNACVSLMSTPLVLKVFFRDRKILGCAALAPALGWGWWDENNGFWLQHQPYSQLATPVLVTWLIISENLNLWLHILTATSLFVYLASPYCWFIFVLQTIPCHLQWLDPSHFSKSTWSTLPVLGKRTDSGKPATCAQQGMARCTKGAYFFNIFLWGKKQG